MIALCIEASQQRGLGHLYKAMNFADHLASRGERYLVMVNDDPQATAILRSRGIPHVTVPLNDFDSDWESAQIRQFGVEIWINDRLDTDSRHAAHVKENGIPLVTFDDRGSGAALCDLHFAPLLFSGQHLLQGRRVLATTRYLVLNPEIDSCRRLRDRVGSIVVTLGGSDTYGATVVVVNLLKRLRRRATIVVGPAFAHHAQLQEVMDGSFELKKGVPSLIREFVHHDLAITGGGVTAFEANACGLPCLIVANELHEIEIGQFLAGVGSSLFAGYHQDMDTGVFQRELDIRKMSEAGMAAITTSGAANILSEIMSL